MELAGAVGGGRGAGAAAVPLLRHQPPKPTPKCDLRSHLGVFFFKKKNRIWVILGSCCTELLPVSWKLCSLLLPLLPLSPPSPIL